MKYESATSLIEEVIRVVPGWTPSDQLLALYALAVTSSNLPGDIVELGSWCGRSTVVLAHAVKQTHGRVHAIDLFPEFSDWIQNQDGSYSFGVELSDGRKIGGYESQTVWEEPFEKAIRPVYDQFGSVRAAFDQALERFEVADVVRVYRSDSTAISRIDDLSIRLAFIDGDHSFDAVCADIRQVLPHLRVGGWISFDDAFSVYDGVDAAIRELIVASERFSPKFQISRKFFAARRCA